MMTQAVKAMNSNPSEATLNLTDPANPGRFRGYHIRVAQLFEG